MKIQHHSFCHITIESELLKHHSHLNSPTTKESIKESPPGIHLNAESVNIAPQESINQTEKQIISNTDLLVTPRNSSTRISSYQYLKKRLETHEAIWQTRNHRLSIHTSLSPTPAASPSISAPPVVHRRYSDPDSSYQTKNLPLRSSHKDPLSITLSPRNLFHTTYGRYGMHQHRHHIPRRNSDIHPKFSQIPKQSPKQCVKDHIPSFLQRDDILLPRESSLLISELSNENIDIRSGIILCILHLHLDARVYGSMLLSLRFSSFFT